MSRLSANAAAGLAFHEFTDEQNEQAEVLRRRLDSAYGTDGAHWIAAREIVGSGLLDEVRREALAPLVEATDFQTAALSEVLAADVWDSHIGRATDYADLSMLAQDARRTLASRHLDALRRFLSR